MRRPATFKEGLPTPFGLSALINCFAENFDTVNDRHDGGIYRNLFEPIRRTGGTALAEKNDLTFAGTDGVDGYDGVLAVLEFGWIFFINQTWTKEEKFSSHHEFVLFGRDNLSNDFC